MSQKQVNKNKGTESVESTLKDRFQSIKNAETQPETRVVKVYYKSCCGCGCSTVNLERTVPYDSELRNGDRVDRIELNDRRL